MGVPLSLAGRVALVSGGSRGIGAATVRLFVAAGAQVLFNYARARTEAERLVEECGPDACAAIPAQLNGTAEVGGLVEACREKFGRVDIVVANHGVWVPEPVAVDEMTPEQWRRTLGVNLHSVFGLLKHSVAQMKRQPRLDTAEPAGHVVLISSSSGQMGESFHADYTASKGALISMTKGLATELAPSGIHVNCVAPGWVETELVAPALADRAARQRVTRNVPLGRLGKPEEIAAAVLFLCTRCAGFITGEVFNVNGGEALMG